jgi:biotin-(acetyl-CoA carboxylase) ligase
MATGQQIDRLRVIVALLEAFNLRCAAITDDDAWVAQWKARCPMLGQQIRARDLGGRKASGGGAREIVGRVQDIDPLRGLLVRDTSGAMRWLTAQTTTLSA